MSEKNLPSQEKKNERNLIENTFQGIQERFEAKYFRAKFLPRIIGIVCLTLISVNQLKSENPNLRKVLTSVLASYGSILLLKDSTEKYWKIRNQTAEDKFRQYLEFVRLEALYLGVEPKMIEKIIQAYEKKVKDENFESADFQGDPEPNYLEFVRFFVDEVAAGTYLGPGDLMRLIVCLTQARLSNPWLWAKMVY